jgi:hypothetical protein
VGLSAQLLASHLRQSIRFAHRPSNSGITTQCQDRGGGAHHRHHHIQQSAETSKATPPSPQGVHRNRCPSLRSVTTSGMRDKGRDVCQCNTHTPYTHLEKVVGHVRSHVPQSDEGHCTISGATAPPHRSGSHRCSPPHDTPQAQHVARWSKRSVLHPAT